MTDPIDVDCPACSAWAGGECVDDEGESVDFHGDRVEHAESALGTDLSHGALDLDGDGVPGALDFNDPSNWW